MTTKPEELDGRDKRVMGIVNGTIAKLQEQGLTVVRQDERPTCEALWATAPEHPELKIELRYRIRGFSGAWMVGKRHGGLQRRRFPLRTSTGKTDRFNYAGIAKAVREMAEQRQRRREMIAETKKMLDAQSAEDAIKQAHFDKELARLAQWRSIETGDARVRAHPEGLRIYVDIRQTHDSQGERIEISIDRIPDALRAYGLVSGFKSLGLWG